MEALERIVNPSIGVLTNIGQAHQENFSNLSEKCSEKLRLFKNVNILVANTDVQPLASQIKEKGLEDRLFRWSTQDKSAQDYVVSSVKAQYIRPISGKTAFLAEASLALGNP